MKGLKGKSRSLNIGRRSRMNVVLGKRIRAQEDGTEVFDDYWTDSDPENSRLTNTSVAPVVDHESSSSEEEEIAKKSCRKLNSNLSNVGERNLSNNYDSEISNLLRDQRNERIPKVRKWLSVSLAGSVKSIGKSFKTKAVKDKAINTSCDKPKQSPNTSEKKDHCYLTFQRDPTDRNSGSEADVEMDVYSRNVSKNFQASKVVQDLSLKSSSFDSTKKEMQLKETENMDEEKSDSDVSTVERFPLTERSVLLKNRILSITSKEAQQTELQIPEKLSSVQNDINDNNESAKAVMSSIKKVEKRSRVEAEYDSDSSLEIFPSKVEVSRNRRHSSSRHSSNKESAQFERSISHINKTVNTSIKKHQIQRTSTPKNNNVSKKISGRFAKQSLSRKSRLIVDYDSDSNSEISPSDDEISRITRHISTAIVPTNKNSSLVMSVSFENNSDLEKRMHGLRVRKNLFQLKNDSSKLRYLEQSPDKRKNREVSADQQIHLSPEKSLSKPEKSPVRKGRSRLSVVGQSHLTPQISPSKPEQSPVRRGRSTLSVVEQSHLTPQISPSKPEQSSVRRGRSTLSLDQQSHLSPEKSPSKAQQLPIKRRSNRLAKDQKSLFSREKSPSKPEQSPEKNRVVIDHRTEISPLKVRVSRNSISTTVVDNDEEPLHIEQSVKEKNKYADSSSKTSQRQVSQIDRNVLQSKNDVSRLSFPERSPVKRKSSSRTINQLSHQSPEASLTKPETSPDKRIRRVTGNELYCSSPEKTPVKILPSRNKTRVTILTDTVGYNEGKSDLEENSVSSVKRNEESKGISREKRNPRSVSASKGADSTRTKSKKSKGTSSSVSTSRPDNGLRRSSRYRVPPLAVWRNERLLFKTLASGEIQCLGVDKGSSEDCFGLQRIAKYKNKVIKEKSKKKTNPEKIIEETEILDIKTGDMVLLHLHRPFSSLEWAVPPSEDKEKPPYMITKGFSSNCLSFGFLDVSPYSVKDEQFSPTDNLHFVVIKGAVDVTIHKTKFQFEKSDSFIVPIGAPYSVKNCSPSRALLSFCTFKIPFYQYQFEE